jgi:ELWxxDGT repeat protein
VKRLRPIRLGVLAPLFILTLPSTATGPAQLVKDINTTFFDAVEMRSWAMLRDELFFTVTRGRTDELWKTDGTTEGTVIVASAAASAFGDSMAAVGDVLYFTSFDEATGRELWRTDGTTRGTFLLRDIYPGPRGDVRRLTAFRDAVYFAADDGVHGPELWKTDGTGEGTVLVSDLLPGAIGSSPYELVVAGNSLYAAARSDVGGGAILRSDGTRDGTVLLRRFPSIRPPGCTRFCTVALPRDLTPFMGGVLFAGTEEATGIELCASDGTPEGTRLVRDVHPGPGFSVPASLTVVGGDAYFSASGSPAGAGIWRTDGTTEGTVLVHEVRPGAFGVFVPWIAASLLCRKRRARGGAVGERRNNFRNPDRAGHPGRP